MSGTFSMSQPRTAGPTYMSHSYGRSAWATVRPGITALVAACLMLSTNILSAAAESEPQPPIMHELMALSPSSFYVRWSDQLGEGPADGLRATVYQNERLVLVVNLGNQPASGSAEFD